MRFISIISLLSHDSFQQGNKAAAFITAVSKKELRLTEVRQLAPGPLASSGQLVPVPFATQYPASSSTDNKVKEGKPHPTPNPAAHRQPPASHTSHHNEDVDRNHLVPEVGVDSRAGLGVNPGTTTYCGQPWARPSPSL